MKETPKKSVTILGESQEPSPSQWLMLVMIFQYIFAMFSSNLKFKSNSIQFNFVKNVMISILLALKMLYSRLMISRGQREGL